MPLMRALEQAVTPNIAAANTNKMIKMLGVTRNAHLRDDTAAIR
jgi:hypothetical protein